MNEQTKELIAIGASVAAHCQPCLKFHYAKARELGVDPTEINAAVEIGHQVSRGAAKAMRDLQEALMAPPSTEASREGGCCGGESGTSKCC